MTASPAAVSKLAAGLQRLGSRHYERNAVLLMSIGLGLVGIDRFLIVPMMPVLMRDLKLDYQDLGHITGALALTWGATALFAGRLADRVGYKQVVVWGLVAFSLLAGISGLATGVTSLVVLRAVMGLAEGAFTPASIVATIDASPPERHGRNVGIQQMMPAVLGLGLTPIAVTQLLRWIDWRWIFVIVAVPGLVVAVLAHSVLASPHSIRGEGKANARHAESFSLRAVFCYRNVWMAIIGMLCWSTALIVIAALFPNYLVDYLHLGLQKMGFVLSSLGVGGALGALILPSLSDRIGRRPVALVSVAVGFVSLWTFARAGASPTLLFATLMGATFAIYSLITLTVGPISAESVPTHLMSTASGTVIGIGEVFGGGVAPAMAGAVAKYWGIQHAVLLPIVAFAVGGLAMFALNETVMIRQSSRELI